MCSPASARRGRRSRRSARPSRGAQHLGEELGVRRRRGSGSTGRCACRSAPVVTPPCARGPALGLRCRRRAGCRCPSAGGRPRPREGRACHRRRPRRLRHRWMSRSIRTTRAVGDGEIELRDLRMIRPYHPGVPYQQVHSGHDSSFPSSHRCLAMGRATRPCPIPSPAGRSARAAVRPQWTEVPGRHCRRTCEPTRRTRVDDPDRREW